MKLIHLLPFLALLVTASVASGICPTMPLRSFEKQRGFTDIIACKDEKTGMTHFRIILSSKSFLSHFKHAFPADRAQVRITLRPKDSEVFKGVTVEMGVVKFGDPDFRMSFQVPSTDLDLYEIEFDCSITWESWDTPVIGGENYFASLQEFRDAKDTVTENSPIWKELEEEHQKRLQHENAGSNPVPEKDQKNAQSGSQHPATSSADKFPVEVEPRNPSSKLAPH